jgi:hypothetical protein
MSDDAVVRAWETLRLTVAGLRRSARGPCARCRAEARVTLEVVALLLRAKAAGMLETRPGH